MVAGTAFSGTPWLMLVGPEAEEVVSLQNHLRRIYKVERVDDLEGATLRAEGRQFHALVYMLSAAELDDWSVVEEFAKHRPAPMVVVGEGMDPPRIAELYLEGISEYVQAPFTVDEVKQAIERALAGE